MRTAIPHGGPKDAETMDIRAPPPGANKLLPLELYCASRDSRQLHLYLLRGDMPANIELGATYDYDFVRSTTRGQ